MRLDRTTQTAGGLALVIGGMWVIHQAWEGRGHKRPFWLHVLPS